MKALSFLSLTPADPEDASAAVTFADAPKHAACAHTVVLKL